MALLQTSRLSEYTCTLTLARAQMHALTYYVFVCMHLHACSMRTHYHIHTNTISYTVVCYVLYLDRIKPLSLVDIILTVSSEITGDNDIIILHHV